MFGRTNSPSGYAGYFDGRTLVNGTLTATNLSGNGSGLTSVNADRLDGLDSGAFLKSNPPLVLTGNLNGFIVHAENASSNSTTGAVLGFSTSRSGHTFGVYGGNESAMGAGVHGLASGPTGANSGVWGWSWSTSGRGVYGLADNPNGFTFGGYFSSSSPTGTGVYGFGAVGAHGKSDDPNGRAVYGEATADTSSINNFGGYFSSRGGTGVYGVAEDGLTSIQTYGVIGRSRSTAGRGVSGVAEATSGQTYGVVGLSDSTSGFGVFGWATAASGTHYGVYGAVTSPGSYGVFAIGDMGASGVKSFRIDHPFDPENKYLLHYAAESPMPQNFYVGNVVTDATGYAWVELPDYFAEINANFKYQLTIVDDADSGGFVMAKISKEIRDNRFQIRTSAPNVKVSWEVKADRNDLYVRRKQPKDVVDKQGLEKGTYQHPELYGLGPERGMNYDSERAKARQKIAGPMPSFRR